MADEALRAQAKTLCERGRWKAAVAKYGAYIDLLLAERESDDRLVIGYSNRAQAFLHLQMYADALEDAESALSLDPQHLKSLVRKAKALQGLKLFEDAVATYKNVLDRDDLHAAHAGAILHSLREAGMKDRQTRLGEFEDIYGVEAQWGSGEGLLEDFVGPIELRRVSGMGRGLFATRDVDPGELLFVSTPIVSVKHPPVLHDSVQVLLSLQSGLEKRVTHACHNLKDFSQAQLLVQLDALAGPYPAGPLSRDVPPIRYFTPVNALAPHLRKLTSQDLQNPAFTTEFNRDTLLEVIRSRQYTSTGATGIYCLPTLINHSCLPNVTVVPQSSGTERTIALCFRASRKIRQGDELFSAYRDIFCPLEDRRIIFPETICTCARCSLENRLLKEIPALRKLERRCSEFWDRRITMIFTHPVERVSVRNRCIESIKSVEQLLLSNSKLRVLNGTEKDWIRASFINFYRLLLEPTLALSPRSSESDQRLQLCMIGEAVRIIRTVNPVSVVAMAMSSEAFRQASVWYNTSVFGHMRLSLRAEADQDISPLMQKLYTEGLEIGRLLCGSQMREEALRFAFLCGGRVSLMATNS